MNGEQRMYADAKRTKRLPDSPYGVTLSVKHRCSDYPGDLCESDLTYHYPETKDAGRNKANLSSTRRARELGLPVFVIVRLSKGSRPSEIRLGWVHGGDDNSKTFRIVFRKDPPTPAHSDTSVDQEIVPLQGEPSKAAEVTKQTAQGFGLSSAINRAIEQRAMSLAATFFSERGYSVDDVSATQPYDLEVIKGAQSLFIEVKGTASPGAKVILTRNEVLHAQQNPDRSVLFAATNISVVTDGEQPVGTGGIVRITYPWIIESIVARTNQLFSHDGRGSGRRSPLSSICASILNRVSDTFRSISFIEYYIA